MIDELSVSWYFGIEREKGAYRLALIFRDDTTLLFDGDGKRLECMIILRLMND